MKNKKKLLVYFGHPAQYLFLREAIRILLSKGYKVKIIIKTKDVLEDLIKADNLDYINILLKPRGNSKLSIMLSLLKRSIKLMPIIIRFRPKLMISTDASIAQLGKIFNIPRITITEDDYEIIKPLANISYPLTNVILCPEPCSVGKWNHKKIGYQGYMKLAYLHPNYFRKNEDVLNRYNLPERFCIIRLAKLVAFHDTSVGGISFDLVQKVISNVERKGLKVYITSEANLDDQLSKYELKIMPSDMQQVLSQATLLVCDSQSMSVEAAILGVPSIRYSNFVGRISVLEELEHVYKLTFGVKEGDEKVLISKLEEVLNIQNYYASFQERRLIMLNDKIDVTAFLVWFIEEYPQSKKIMTENPDFQFQFK